MQYIIVFLLVVFPAIANAQWGTSAIKIGYFSPAASDGGLILGYEGGKKFDRNLTIGWSVDWFNKNYVDKKLVNDFNTVYGIGGSSINELRAKTNLHDFPFMLNLTAHFPVAPRLRVNVMGGIGAEVLLIYYRNFQNPDDSNLKGAFAFNWRIGVGTSYDLGPRSEVFGELAYHSSTPSWEYEVQDAQTGINRVFERVFDMSGIIARVGVRFYY